VRRVARTVLEVAAALVAVVLLGALVAVMVPTTLLAQFLSWVWSLVAR
jgi:hypothetical protein